MMRKMLSIAKQDFILAYRNGFFLAVMVLLLVVSLVVTFLPEGSSEEQVSLYLDLTEARRFEGILKSWNVPSDTILESVEELETALTEGRGTVGIVISGTEETPAVTVVSQTPIGERQREIVIAGMNSMLAAATGQDRSFAVTVEYLRERSEPIPSRKKMLPGILIVEVAAIGFFFAAVIMFQERQEGTISAYRVTSAGLWPYVVSKNVMFLVTAVVYGALLLLIGVGTNADYLASLLIVGLTAIYMTNLSMFASVFFSSLSEWFFVGFGVMLVNLLPAISYAIPTFQPRFITWMPTYHAIFGLKEAIFQTGKSGYLGGTLVWIGIAAVVTLGVASLGVSNRLMREGRW